ncbi:conserved hypothetical protein [Neospora caninum Liverpool]|uniref:Uncharacterized protein n=1 Tax=Neospora caninum (strain Liverpool) TaxID=572307 RepID=F0V8X0_NEOCL|nr:conserved hypothetical protein [Neospora caninum Liverpool]CBZ50161.1 conserved hypothetical protein [Neospora caninum Liverpool]CEL64756.1 TPA: hypothetical protein BN1204_006370 [Neospora caninum Liverpool]|eukprot:XP_003880196.1 conserved hypothetical protein [Neospora caninum Liverpool]
MIVAAKHARNPFHPGVMHFVFGFSILATLAFAGVCGMLVSDSLGLVNKFTAQVHCAPLAGAVNQACVAARQFVTNSRLQGQVLLVLTAVVGLFAIFGEMIIIWACLEVCCFGSHIHCTVAGGTCGAGCGHCGGEPVPIAVACDPGGPPVVGCVAGGQCRPPPVGIPIAPGCCSVDSGGCDRCGSNLCATSGPVGTGPISVGPVAGGSATSVLPPTKTSTATHTSHSNPCHASCPMDADTQQRTAVENPVANTCQISINTAGEAGPVALGLEAALNHDVSLRGMFRQRSSTANASNTAVVLRLLRAHRRGEAALLLFNRTAIRHLGKAACLLVTGLRAFQRLPVLLVTGLGALPSLPVLLVTGLGALPSLPVLLVTCLEARVLQETGTLAAAARYTQGTVAAALPQLKRPISGARDGGREPLQPIVIRRQVDCGDLAKLRHAVPRGHGPGGGTVSPIPGPCLLALEGLPGAVSSEVRCPLDPLTTMGPRSTRGLSQRHRLSRLFLLLRCLATDTHSQGQRHSSGARTSRCRKALCWSLVRGLPRH